MPNTGWTDRYAVTTDGGCQWTSNQAWNDFLIEGQVLKRDGWQSASWIPLPNGNLLCPSNRENSIIQLIPTKIPREITYTERFLDLDFIVSDLQDARVQYTIKTTILNDLVNLGLQDAKCDLLVDGSIIATVANALDATLSLGLSLTTTKEQILSAYVPKGSTVRLSTSGTGTCELIKSEEFLLRT